MTRPRLISALALLAIAVPLLAAAPASATPTESTPTNTTPTNTTPATCRERTVPVALTPGAPADQTVAGTLCSPRGAHPDTVQLLLPGGTYDRSYWTMRGDPRGPSYVEYMSRAGHATFAMDRLGTGASAAPHSSRFAPDSHRDSVHQVVLELRRTYARVVLVGNSLGSTLARMVAEEWPGDVDGLVLTGESSTPNWDAFAELGAAYVPASRDPRVAGRGLDDGYTSLPIGGKSAWMYHRPTASPLVMAFDELTGEPDVFAMGDAGVGGDIDVPVYVIVGEFDRFLCGPGATDCSSSAALLAGERPHYPADAKLEALVVADTGHVLNLHRTAATWFAEVDDWLDRNI
ncbi:alpha/beta hydrolase [Phytomonospora endophytica]|uniref:Pimeloyl-ACP methyl ester carboxylesterase n=1 Tax=Phytomonospora endophytica TaxID=714109 RepID=A0A841FJ09_9ACTN|nr:alpha/beta hydrolase [Phytomonospora endophytica]MBB6033137.1 pimeloyl-ACP methyl ester carboxylesterase [Phytomonospora endophytica]GIG65363.1 alpha/beta hydrolase [Phytomonospora endophytica]